MNTFFEITTYLCDQTGRHYPHYEVYQNVRYYAQSLEEVEVFVSAFSLSDGMYKDCMVFAFYVKELPYGEKLFHGSISERVYDGEGKLVDERLYSTVHDCGKYLGRTPEQIRFKEGDIVEVWYGDYVELAFVVGLPISVERAVEINNRFMEKGSCLCLDESDDSYMVMTSSKFESHEHVSALTVFLPRFPIPKRTRERLEKAFVEYKNKLENV